MTDRERERYIARRRSGLCIETGCDNATGGKCRCPEHESQHNAKMNENKKRHASLRLNLKRNYKS